jgi:hypothetical protein
MNVEEAINLIFQTLKEMDDDESTLGLRAYEKELWLTELLASKLTAKELTTNSGSLQYPDKRCFCDLIITLNEGTLDQCLFWVEVKLFWTVWGLIKPNRVALSQNIQQLGGLMADWNMKLCCKLKPNDARYIGALLFCFHAEGSYRFNDVDLIDRFENGLLRSPKRRQPQPEEWRSPRPQFPFDALTTFWLWYQELEQLPDSSRPAQ